MPFTALTVLFTKKVAIDDIAEELFFCRITLSF